MAEYRTKGKTIKYMGYRGYSGDLRLSILFVKRYYKDLIVLTLPLLGLIGLATWVMTPYLHNDYFDYGFMSTAGPFFFILVADYALIMPAVYRYIEWRRQEPEAPMKPIPLLLSSLKSLPILLLLSPIVSFIMLISFLFLSFPLIYMVVPLSLVFPIVCLDIYRHGFHLKVLKGLGKAFRLGNLRWGNNFMLIVITSIVAYTILLAPLLPIGFASYILYALDISLPIESWLGDQSFVQRAALKLGNVAMGLYNGFFYVLSAIPYAFRYYNLEDEYHNSSLKEAYDAMAASGATGDEHTNQEAA